MNDRQYEGRRSGTLLKIKARSMLRPFPRLLTNLCPDILRRRSCRHWLCSRQRPAQRLDRCPQVQDGIRKGICSSPSLCVLDFKLVLDIQRRHRPERQTAQEPSQSRRDHHLPLPGAHERWRAQVSLLYTSAILHTAFPDAASVGRFPSYIGEALDKDAPKDAEIPPHRKAAKVDA